MRNCIFEIFPKNKRRKNTVPKKDDTESASEDEKNLIILFKINNVVEALEFKAAKGLSSKFLT